MRILKLTRDGRAPEVERLMVLALGFPRVEELFAGGENMEGKR